MSLEDVKTSEEVAVILGISSSRMRQIAQSINNEKLCRKTKKVYLISQEWIDKEKKERGIK